jgi:hypothetical protein
MWLSHYSCEVTRTFLSNACQYKRLAAMNKLASCRKGRVLGMQEVQFSGLKINLALANCLINPSNRASWHLTQNKVWSTAKNGSLSSGSGLAQMVCYAKELGVLLNNVWSTYSCHCHCHCHCQLNKNLLIFFLYLLQGQC